LGANADDIGLAGLKDANAVTRQWLSVEHADPERVRGWTIRGVRVLRAERHPHKLRIGHAKGNRFAIRIRNLDIGDAPRAMAILDELERRGMPNMYGTQRFGRDGKTLLMGLALLRNDAGEFERLAGTSPARTERRLRSLCLSAVQSEAFNRFLDRRMPQIGTLADGDVAFLHASGASFVVESAAAEQPRADRMEISPSGPIIGSRLLRGSGEPRALEDAVFAELSLAPAAFADLPFGLEARGARRPLRVPVENLERGTQDSDLLLSFSLPSGSYATSVVRELLGSPAPESLDRADAD
jgi:tRNA pseudouridine13 synthase